MRGDRQVSLASSTSSPTRSVRSLSRQERTSDWSFGTRKVSKERATRENVKILTEKEGSKDAGGQKKSHLNFFANRRAKLDDESWLFHPHSRSVQNWNIIVALLLAIQAAILPLQVAFLSDKVLVDIVWLLWFDLWADLVLWLDVVLQFFLQVQSADRSYWIRDSRGIAWRYLKGELLVDVCGLVPFRSLVSALVFMVPVFPGLRSALPKLGQSNARCTLSLVGFHKLLRFTRVVRVARSLDSLKSLDWLEQFTYRNSRLVKSAFTVAFACHVLGCIWATLAVCGDEDRTWFHLTFSFKGNGDDYQKTWAMSIFFKYTCGLYWAVATVTGVGYGDIVPVSPIEYMVAGFCMLMAALVWAWITANVVSIMSTMNEANNEHLQTMDCINAIMHEKDVKVHLGRRLREYFTKLRDINEHNFIAMVVERLSPDLKLEVIHAIHDMWIEKVWWLRKVPSTSEFMVDLALQMDAILHAPSEMIPNRQELCAVLQGLCMYGGCLKARGQVFGEDMLLNNEALRKPYATLVLTFLHTLVLTRPLLNGLVVAHPEVAVSIRKSYVKFAVMRGMLWKAATYKRKLREEQKKRGSIRSMSMQTMTGDPEDAEDSIAVQLTTAPSKRSVASKGSRASTRFMMPERKLSKSLITTMVPVDVACSSSREDATSLLVGEDHRNDQMGGGATVEELDAMATSTRDLTSALRTRASGLEAAATRLLEQARRLEEF